MGMNFKAISFDLDGTLLTEEKKIEQSTVSWIREYQRQGGLVILASGRKLKEVLPYAHQLGMIETNRGYIAYSNGAHLLDIKTNAEIDFPHLSEEKCEEIISAIDNNLGKGFLIIVTEEKDYLLYVKKSVKYWLRKVIYEVLKNNTSVITKKQLKKIRKPIEKIMISINDVDYLKNCMKDVKEICVNLIDGVRTEVTCEGLDKVYAIEEILIMERLKKEDVLVFGDDNNDLLSFQRLPNTVAMGNGTPNIKTLAKYQTDSNENNGVLRFLKENLNSVSS